MNKPKSNEPVTVTVRPDGTYYVEHGAPKAGKPSKPLVQMSPVLVGAPQKPEMGVQVKTTLKKAVAMAEAVRLVGAKIGLQNADKYGAYGGLAVLGFGLLRALATPEPPPRVFQLRRVKVRK